MRALHWLYWNSHKWSSSDVIVMLTDGIVIFLISAFLETSGRLFYNMKYSFICEQEKQSIIRMRQGYKNPSLGITVCHHSASLVMPNDDPRDNFFYPTHTLMMNSYILF